MERIWDGDAAKQHLNKWIVMVNCAWEQGNKNYGEVYFVTADRKEAYKVAKELRLNGNMGSVLVMEGHSDVQSQLGGLFICVQ